jgi:homospermidine synthase
VTAPIIETLNISLIFYKSLHVIREKIQLEVLHQNSNSALSDGQLSKSNFAISLARDDTMKRQIMGISEKLNLATIQTHLLSWDGFTKDDISQSETEQYIEMVPSYMVFNNILSDLISRLGITNEITVIYDEKYRKFLRLI